MSIRDESHVTDTPYGPGHGSFKSYVFGFIWSIILTLVAYFLVTEHLLSGWNLIFTIVGLGVVQTLIQLLFFLHLGSEPKPRRYLLIFLFMALVLAILVGGSLWIMHNLDERVMSPMDMQQYMIRQKGI
jgi:cytochrome o ubiquinol oxidase subunit IV